MGIKNPASAIELWISFSLSLSFEAAPAAKASELLPFGTNAYKLVGPQR